MALHEACMGVQVHTGTRIFFKKNREQLIGAHTHFQREF